MDKWDIPYNGKATTKKFAFKKSGVYLIRDAFTKIITYIGMSKSCAYKAMYRHFEQWNDYKQYRVTYTNKTDFEVRLILVEPQKAIYLERRLIKYFNPRDNTERYEETNETLPEIEPEFIPQLEEAPF